MLWLVPAALSADIDAWVRPSAEAVVRPDAIPEDQLQVGTSAANAGLVVTGDASETVSGTVYLLLSRDVVEAVTAVSAVDQDNNGSIDGVATSTRSVASSLVREASLTWAPTESLALKGGHMPIPFTSQSQSADTALLFATRSGPTSEFIADDDLGVLALGSLVDVATVQGGAFLGSASGEHLPAGTRGGLYLARVDVHPLGDFDFDETVGVDQPLRIGLGAGLAWHPYVGFDTAGYEAIRVNDVRAAGSARIGVAGFSAGAEVLWREETNDLNHRPSEALGGYLQAGFHSAVGLEPVVRIGLTEEDRSFDTRRTRWLDIGANWYASERVKLSAQYLGEHRLTEGELAHGGRLALQAEL